MWYNVKYQQLFKSRSFILKNYFTKILNNKIYIIFTLIVFISSYGFSIVNHSLGIDDFAVEHYLSVNPDNYGNMVQQGRLTHLIIYYIFNIIDVIPFFNNFIAMIFLFLSAMLLCVIFQYVSNDYFKTYQLIIFSCIYGTFSNIAFKYIYDLDVLVTTLSYILVPLSILLFLEYLNTNNKKYIFFSIISLFLAIGSYETFNILYILEVLLILILLSHFKGYNLLNIIKLGLMFFINLLCSFFIYYISVYIIRLLTNNEPYVRTNIFNNNIALKKDLLKVYYRFIDFNFLFNIEIVLSTIVFIIISIIFLLKFKNLSVFILLYMLIAFSFIIHIIQGTYFIRTGQVFNFYVASAILLIFITVKGLDKTLVVLSVILVTLQIKDLNKWFYKDYINYQKNIYAINKIATDLVENYDVDNKPVLFINRDYESKLLMAWDDNQGEIGESALISSVRFLGNKTSKETIKLFEYRGYTFLKEPSKEQAEYIYELSPKLKKYPNKGYIEEIDNVIVVNMGG